MSSPSSTGRYAFDRFRLTSDGTLLCRGDDVIPLAPKVLQTLLVLVQRAGDVVTKDELLRTVWPDCFVEETGLTRNVSLLRQALDVDGRHFIVTVARVGYRFAAPVEFVPNGRLSRRPDPTRVIVGRDRERQRMLDAVDRAREGAGSILAIAGEPGIGKTTIVEQVLEGLPHHCLVGRGRSSEQFADAEAHLPVLEAVHELAEHPLAAETLRRKAPTWARYLRLDGSAPVDSATDAAPSGNPDRLLRELTLFLDTVARHHMVVLFLDDMHWADRATVDALAHLASRLGRMRVLVVVTYRQNELALARHPLVALRGELLARGEMDEVRVSLLAREDVACYVRATSVDGDLPSDLAALVFERSEGNPLFMTALLRFLTSDAPGRQLNVPDSLRGLIDRMLQRLDAAGHVTLTVGAVQGDEFDSATVALASDTAPAEIEERLRAAEHTHALVVRERDTVLPDGTFTVVYRFVHSLYQSALLTSLTPSRRVTWAQRVADALVQLHAGRTDAIAGPLATLFEDSRDHRQAALYFLAASRNASRLFAFANASQLAERGLHCVSLAPGLDEQERARLELPLTFARLAPLSCLEGLGSQAVEILTRRLMVLAESMGDATAMAHALRATSMVGLVRGECAAARDAGIRLIALARAADDDILLVNAHMQTQIACHHLGEFGEAAEHAATVITYGRRLPHRDRCISIFDPVVGSLAESARNLWITGHLTRAPIESARAVSLGREVGHPESMAFAWLFDAWIHGYAGEWAACIRSADAGVATAREAGAVQTLAWNRCVRGWATAHTGDVNAGHDELSAAIRSSQAIMGEVAMPQFRAMMAEVLLLAGDVEGAERWLGDALTSGRAHDDRYFAAEVCRLAARCAGLREAGADRAIAYVEDALAIAREQGARTFELRAALVLGEWDAARGAAAVRGVLEHFPEPAPWPEIIAARQTLAACAAT